MSVDRLYVRPKQPAAQLAHNRRRAAIARAAMSAAGRKAAALPPRVPIVSPKINPR